MNANVTSADLKNKGVLITLGGKEYDLEFDMNALCDMQDRYGTLDKAFDKVSNNLNMKDLRFILWKALQHSEPKITEQETGRLITLQDIDAVTSALNAAMGAALPEPDGDEKNVKKPQETENSRG